MEVSPNHLFYLRIGHDKPAINWNTSFFHFRPSYLPAPPSRIHLWGTPFSFLSTSLIVFTCEYIFQYALLHIKLIYHCLIDSYLCEPWRKEAAQPIPWYCLVNRCPYSWLSSSSVNQAVYTSLLQPHNRGSVCLMSHLGVDQNRGYPQKKGQWSKP